MTEEWRKYYTRPACCQGFEIPVVSGFLFLAKGSVREVIYIPYKGKWEAWYPVKPMERFMEKLGRSILKRGWKWENHLKQFYRAAGNLRKIGEILQKTSGTTSRQGLLRNYKALIKAYRDYALFIWQPWSITIFLENWFTRELQKRHKDWQKIYETIARSSETIQTQRMIEEVWKWKIKKTAGGGQRGIDAIVKKFAFLGAYSVNDKVWNKKDILRQSGSLINCEDKLRDAREQRAKNKKAVEQVVKRLREDNKLLAKAAQVINGYVWLRTERVDEYKRAMVLCAHFYRRLEKEFGWPFGFAAHLSMREVINALSNGIVPSLREMQKRDRLQYVVYMTARQTIIIADKKMRERFLKRILGVGVGENEASSMQGSVAFPGRVKGRVQIILNAKDCYLFRRGHILVANMTHPDYMPAIRKSAAIITDEGGIVCHAAIISRELKIPCVVGAKFATKVLKDGDLVEVDAEQGIVRKL